MSTVHEPVKVLDIGFVHLVEWMGGDRGVVQAARVCYKSDGLSLPEKDKKLVEYLMEHKHGTPFEHSVLKFHVKAPLFVARQWFRHRMASYNEVSGRYTVLKDEFYEPEVWRRQDTKNKQGSAGVLDEAKQALAKAALKNVQAVSMAAYNTLLALGVSKEMARFVLPVNIYTEWYWTVNARSLMNFLDLRCDAHAQWETRQYADVIYRMFAEIMPWTAGAMAKGWKLENYDVLKVEG